MRTGIIALLASILVGLVVIMASGVTRVPGNIPCSTLFPGSAELKIEPVLSGTYSGGDLSVTLAVSGSTFDFTSNMSVDGVIVKGGPDELVYKQTEGEFTSGTGLHAPKNPSNGKYYGLSHVSFCYSGTPAEPTPTPTATTRPSTATPSATSTPRSTATPTATPTATSTPLPTATPTEKPTNTATATPTKTKTPTAIEVRIDVKPGSDPNSVNLTKNGTVAVAVFSSPQFDATTIDRATVVFAGAHALSTGQSAQDVDGDGRLDMVFHFAAKDLLLPSGTSTAMLTGKTVAGKAFYGYDSVRVVK